MILGIPMAENVGSPDHPPIAALRTTLRDYVNVC